ncbi:MAG: patatin-like phospholipase family protein [Myxococcota bacterium]
MHTPKARRTLFLSPLLRDLPDATREEAAGLFDETTLRQGEVIFREGDAEDASYLLVEGAVDISLGDRTLARLAPGEAFGLAFGSNEARRVTATAAIDCRLLALPRDRVARFRELQPADFSDELRRVAARAMDLLSGGADSGITRFVLFRSDEPWRHQRRFLADLADALERESGGPVAVATLAPADGAEPPGPVRDNGLDWVVTADLDDRAAVRSQVTRELGERTAKVRFVLGESAVPGAAGLEPDVLIQRVSGRRLPDLRGQARQVIFLYEGREGAGPALDSADRVQLAGHEPERSRAIERLARRLCGHTVGVALGSGAAWGLSHIGVLEVLDEAGVPVDLVCGASMGAIVGGHYALGIRPAELREIVTRVKTARDFLGIMPELLYLAADFNVVKPGLFAGEHFKKLLASIAPITGKTFSDLVIPFRSVATDIETGARAEIRDGELADAIHASFAAPAILSPHRIGDGVYIDGGMVDPVPAETARRMGADLVIAVNVVPPLNPDVHNPLDRFFAAAERLNPLARLRPEEQHRIPGAFDALVRTIQLMQYQLGNDRAGEADVLIHPSLEAFHILEFWAGEPMIARGAEATREALPRIRERLAAWQKTG